MSRTLIVTHVLLFALLLTAICRPLLAQPQNATGATLPLRVMQDVSVTMRDGVQISLDIYRPAQAGQYPTLYAAGPGPHADTATPATSATGPVARFVAQGYNYVLASVRGTGASTGSFGFLSREEQQDHYEIIEWIAAQDWSNGQVAGVGAGYYGTSQWYMAIQNPPHLSCVAPVDAVSDPYRDWAWPGGLANAAFIDWYEREVRDRNAWPVRGEPRYVELDLRLEQLRHPLLDDYWFTRSAINHFAEIRIPVLALASPGAAQALSLKQHARLPASSRVHLTTTADQLQDPAILENVLLPFYQWCFGGQDPAVLARSPKLSVAVQNQPQIRNLSEWPAASVRFTPLYLHGGADTGTTAGELSTLPPDRRGSAEMGEGTELTALTFVSPVLTQDVELLGPLLLELHASSTATDSAFRVELLEEVAIRQVPGVPAELPSFLNPDSSPTLEALTATTTTGVSSGQLKASARQLVGAPGPDFQPEYAFTSSNRISAGSVIRYDIALEPAAYRFRAGNRIVLRIAQTADASLHGQSRKDSLHYAGQYPSRLWLPLLPDPTLPLSAPFAPFAAANTPAAVPEPAVVLPSEAEPAALDADELFNGTNPVILVPRR